MFRMLGHADRKCQQFDQIAPLQNVSCSFGLERQSADLYVGFSDKMNWKFVTVVLMSQSVEWVKSLFPDHLPSACHLSLLFVCVKNNWCCFCSDTLYMLDCHCVFMVNWCATSKCLQTFGHFNESELNINGLWIIPYEVSLQWCCCRFARGANAENVNKAEGCAKLNIYYLIRLKLLVWEWELAYSFQGLPASTRPTIQQAGDRAQATCPDSHEQLTISWPHLCMCFESWWETRYSIGIEEHMQTPHCLPAAAHFH